MKTTETCEGTNRPLSRRLRRRAALALALGALLGLAAVASAAPALTWSAPAGVAAGLDGVSCPSFGLCVAVAGTAAQITSTPSADSGWSSANTNATHPLRAVSCAPGTTVCVAVGDSGQITATANAQSGGGSSWTATTTTDAGNNLTSVSCPNTSFCLAVDNHGNAVYSTSPGSGPWSLASGIDSTTGLLGVSCASSALCVAVDASGNILVSTTPTASALWTTSDTATGVTGVACSLAGTCVAVTSMGKTVASGNPSAADPTWTMSRPSSSYALTSVSCTVDGFCIAGDSNGDVYESDNVAAAPPIWSSTKPDSAAITGVSCVSDGLCAAVDTADALTATLPAPAVATGSASAISQTTATLSATVTPSDATITSCYFNYGTTTAYGASAPCTSTPSATGGAQTVTAQITGLTGSSTYDFQVVATSADGTTGGANASFATPAPLKPSVSITGTAAVGNTLTCALGVTLPAGLTVTYKWVRDTTTIAGAIAGTYVVALADESHHLYCGATVSGDGGSASGSSAYVSVPAETIGTVQETTVSRASVANGGVSTTVTCSPQALTQCTISLRLTTPASKHRTIAIGSKTERIGIGASVTVTVSLNANGLKLVSRKGHLKATLTVTGTIVGTISGTIKKQAITLTRAHHARRDGG